MRALLRNTVWSEDGIRPDETRWRSALRVWLPFWDILVLGGGIWATSFGSPLLHRLFPEMLIDWAGLSMALAAVVCLVGVSIPRLWPIEVAGKLALVFLLGAYAGTVMVYPSNPDASNGFIVFILIMAIVPGLIRINVLADDINRALARLVARWRARRAGK